jgi:two-component system NtrC family sensor kinase
MRNFEDDPTLADLLTEDQQQRLSVLISNLCQTPVRLSEKAGEPAVPLEFNLETIGWLRGGGSDQERQAAADLASFIMLFVAKYRLAANLHHDTTEASYAELQRQNEALKASEARYRELSDQLQDKVEEQVGVIRQAQLDLYESSRMRSVGQLAAGVAHEINNPIGFIASNLRVARDYVEEISGLLPDNHNNREMLQDFRDLVDESVDGTKRIASIVADLKTFSSIDQADYSPCDLNDLLKSALHLLQTEYDNQLEVIERFSDLPPIAAHPGRLSQTFYNILDNAALAIRDKQENNGRIRIRTEAASDSITIEIQDNGCGIPEAARGQVFDAFYTDRPVGSGTGLGLTVARDTIRAHGGNIRIDSLEGQGTRVTITLPSG